MVCLNCNKNRHSETLLRTRGNGNYFSIKLVLSIGLPCLFQGCTSEQRPGNPWWNHLSLLWLFSFPFNSMIMSKFAFLFIRACYIGKFVFDSWCRCNFRGSLVGNMGEDVSKLEYFQHDFNKE
jgi:hypothetical protein